MAGRPPTARPPPVEVGDLRHGEQTGVRHRQEARTIGRRDVAAVGFVAVETRRRTTPRRTSCSSPRTAPAGSRRPDPAGSSRPWTRARVRRAARAARPPAPADRSRRPAARRRRASRRACPSVEKAVTILAALLVGIASPSAVCTRSGPCPWTTTRLPSSSITATVSSSGPKATEDADRNETTSDDRRTGCAPATSKVVSVAGTGSPTWADDAGKATTTRPAAVGPQPHLFGRAVQVGGADRRSALQAGEVPDVDVAGVRDVGEGRPVQRGVDALALAGAGLSRRLTGQPQDGEVLAGERARSTAAGPRRPAGRPAPQAGSAASASANASGRGPRWQRRWPAGGTRRRPLTSGPGCAGGRRGARRRARRRGGPRATATAARVRRMRRRCSWRSVPTSSSFERPWTGAARSATAPASTGSRDNETWDSSTARRSTNRGSSSKAPARAGGIRARPFHVEVGSRLVPDDLALGDREEHVAGRLGGPPVADLLRDPGRGGRGRRGEEEQEAAGVERLLDRRPEARVGRQVGVVAEDLQARAAGTPAWRSAGGRAGGPRPAARRPAGCRR